MGFQVGAPLLSRCLTLSAHGASFYLCVTHVLISNMCPSSLTLMWESKEEMRLGHKPWALRVHWDNQGRLPLTRAQSSPRNSSRLESKKELHLPSG